MRQLGFVNEEDSPPATSADTTTVTQQPERAEEQPAAESEQPKPPKVETPTPIAVSADTTGLIADTMAIDTVRIVTKVYEALLVNHGGGPVSILLQKYTYRDSGRIEMMHGAETASPVLVFNNGEFSTANRYFACDLRAGSYDATRQDQEITYTYSAPGGGQIVKRYTFHPSSYDIDLAVELYGLPQLGFERGYDIIWNNPLWITEPQEKEDFEAMTAVVMQGGSRDDLDDWEDDTLSESATGSTDWAGVRSKYFTATMIPGDPTYTEGAFARGRKVPVRTADGVVEGREITVGVDVLLEGDAATVSHNYKLYVGPLDYLVMSHFDVGLEDMLGIGTFPVIGWLIKPFAIAIMWLLPKIHSVIPNYGFVIIIFAFLVKIITLPLSLKSFKSMNAMKELQPKMEEVKKKYKKDPQKLNAEIMKMYKAHGVNPMSGCLPILPQMPLFFALFAVFRSTILLRAAPFIWFFDDLSRGAKGVTDPYIIMVILMVITQFISQKLTMASTQQNKALFMLMPLVFGFIFYRLPSGLVLYWTCFSLFSLIDYFLFRRGKKKAAVEPATA